LFGLLQKNRSKKDTYACVQWALENREKLESLGFSLENLKIDGRNIDTVTITFSNSIQNDWFDIKMTVISDDFEFNFSDLIPNIKSQNRLFYPTEIIFDSIRMDDAVRCHGKTG
jgi:non-specific serine/threonine protein kinase